MQGMSKMKKTIYSVTNFIHCGDDYLFIHRTKRDNKVDEGRLNGVGGKLEPGENFFRQLFVKHKKKLAML